jgi:hemolysin III
MQRVTLGRMQNPVRGFLHGGAAIASLVGLGFLLARAWGSAPAVVGASIFSIALVVQYTVSALYHSIPWSESWKARLQRVDHSMIFLLVAGTFTPIAIAALEGATLAVGLGVLWVMALAGILLKLLLPRVKTWLSVTIQLSMGWLALAWIPQIYGELGVGGIVLIVMGGLSYTVGAVIFMTKRPRLAPRSFSYHELFHVLVIVGSSLHFAAVLAYAIPATVSV